MKMASGGVLLPIPSSHWITHFEAAAASSTSISCRWSIDANYVQYVRDLRILIQPEYNTKANYTDPIDTSVTDFTLQNLNANTRYKVCLRFITPKFTDERSCADVSTSFGFVPALVGSVIGLVSAFLILACLIALSRYMQKRGIWVFRAPLKTADRRSPEEKSLLKKENKDKESPTSKAPQNATPSTSRPAAQRTPAKPAIRPENLVEEIYCGDEGDSQSQRPKATTNGGGSQRPSIANSTAASAASAKPDEKSQTQVQASLTQSANVETTQQSSSTGPASSSPVSGQPPSQQEKTDETATAANGKLVTEALVTPECTRENSVLAVENGTCDTSTPQSQSQSQSQSQLQTVVAMVAQQVESATSDSVEQLDNEKNESVYSERVAEMRADAAVVVDTVALSSPPSATPTPTPTSNTAPPVASDKRNSVDAVGASTASASMSTSATTTASIAPPVNSPITNHVDHTSVALRSTPTLSAKKTTAQNDYATIQMNDAPLNGSLRSGSLGVSIRPPTGIYMQFVETL